MADNETLRVIPPRPAAKPRNLRETSVGNIDQAGLDVVGSSTLASRPKPSQGSQENPQRVSGMYTTGPIPRPDRTPRNEPNRSSTGASSTPAQWQQWQLEQDRLALPEPYPTDSRTPTGTPATTSHASLESKRERHDIIYRLELNDPSRRATTFRYSLDPFEGLDRSDSKARRDLAVMDLSSSVSGFWQRERKNQLRDNFLRDDDSEPFVIGRDFVARSHTFYSIRIHSSRVLDVLRSLIPYYPSLGLQLQETEVFFMYPYRVLVYYHKQLEALKDECDLVTNEDELCMYRGTTTLGKATHKDLTVVLGYLKPFYDREILPELQRHQNQVARFPSLWLLFRPGSTVFARVKGQLMFFKVLSANREVDSAGESSGPWSIIVWGLYFDGYLLKRQARRFKIHEYHDERDIQKLPIKPIEYLLPKDGEKANLIKRGKIYYETVCEVPTYRRYSGLVNGDRGDGYVGDVIIDPVGYAKESADDAKRVPSNFEVMFGARVAEDDFGSVIGEPPDYGGGPYAKLNDRLCEKGTSLGNDEEYLLLPGHIQGYALGRKQWLAFDLDSFLDEDTARPWESLVMDKDDLNLVQSIAGQHRGDNVVPWTADFIPGKGQGQVVLLHGPPGTGKTMTCECIARQMGKPILSLTVADIGKSEEHAEANIAKYLGLATKWGAIVLIDEAETFLTKRLQGDFSRNAIVTAFLRALEYYRGMIFLTTNEPGRLDEAVRSRIHLAIKYNPLDQPKRRKIWIAHIKQLKKEQDSSAWPKEVPKITVDETTQNQITSEQGVSDIEELFMSGRDIRNAFQTAVKLARYESQNQPVYKGQKPQETIELTVEHFKKAMETKLKLKKLQIGGLNEEEAANIEGKR